MGQEATGKARCLRAEEENMISRGGCTSSSPQTAADPHLKDEAKVESDGHPDQLAL